MIVPIKNKGFTLLELLVAITIIGVLTAVALPIYTRYTQKAVSADAQSQMLKLAGDLERWRAKTLSYTGFVPESGYAAAAGSLVAVTGATIYLPKGSTSSNYKYQIALLDGTRTAALNSTNVTAGQGWIMIAQPNTAVVSLSAAPRLVLSSQGLRCLTNVAVSDSSMKTKIATSTASDASLCVDPSKPW